MAEKNPLQAWLDQHEESKAAFARRMDCSDVHIHRICTDDPRVSPELAVRIFKETGVRIGPLRNASEDDAEAVARVLAPAPVEAAQ